MASLKGGVVKQIPSRREFLQSGLFLPTAGFVASRSLQKLPSTASRLTYRTLGKTGLKVTAVGCAAGSEPNPDILARALDLGINYYDTARIYGGGKSEQVLGKALQGKRDKIVLASKTYSNTKAKILEDIETSLKTLGTDHLDIYHQHSRHEPKEITDEMIETMELVKKQLINSGERERAVAGVVLTGGGSMLEGMLELSEQILEMPVRQGLPRSVHGLVDELCHPVYATAIGLAMFGAQESGSGRKGYSGKAGPIPLFINRLLSWVGS